MNTECAVAREIVGIADAVEVQIRVSKRIEPGDKQVCRNVIVSVARDDDLAVCVHRNGFRDVIGQRGLERNVTVGAEGRRVKHAVGREASEGQMVGQAVTELADSNDAVVRGIDGNGVQVRVRNRIGVRDGEPGHAARPEGRVQRSILP